MWNAAETRLGETEAEIANTRLQIGQLQARVSRIQTRLEKRAVLLPLEPGYERVERARAVADEADLHGRFKTAGRERFWDL